MEEKKDLPRWLRIIFGILLFVLSIAIELGIIDLYVKYIDPFQETIPGRGPFIEFLLYAATGLLFYLSGFGPIVIFACLIMQVMGGKERFYDNTIYYPEQLKLSDTDNKHFIRVDDEFLIYDFSQRKFVLLIGLCMFIPGIIGGYFAEFNGSKADAFERSGIIAFLIISLLPLLYGLFHPGQRYVFNRMKGTVTLPTPLWLPSCTIPFSKAVPGNAFGSLGLCHPFLGGMVRSIYGEMTPQWWSFYVLYMDRNRPLPPGSAFDAYREKDFLRRKAEGFPEPLYEDHFYMDDVTMGYFYCTPEFREKKATFKISYNKALKKVFEYVYSNNIYTGEMSGITLIGIYQKSWYFRLDIPRGEKFTVIPDSETLTKGFLVNGRNANLEFIG